MGKKAICNDRCRCHRRTQTPICTNSSSARPEKFIVNIWASLIFFCWRNLSVISFDFLFLVKDTRVVFSRLKRGIFSVTPAFSKTRSTLRHLWQNPEITAAMSPAQQIVSQNILFNSRRSPSTTRYHKKGEKTLFYGQPPMVPIPTDSSSMLGKMSLCLSIIQVHLQITGWRFLLIKVFSIDVVRSTISVDKCTRSDFFKVLRKKRLILLNGLCRAWPLGVCKMVKEKR